MITIALITLWVLGWMFLAVVADIVTEEDTEVRSLLFGGSLGPIFMVFVVLTVSNFSKKVIARRKKSAE